jgi:hypothetical protein
MYYQSVPNITLGIIVISWTLLPPAQSYQQPFDDLFITHADMKASLLPDVDTTNTLDTLLCYVLIHIQSFFLIFKVEGLP